MIPIHTNSQKCGMDGKVSKEVQDQAFKGVQDQKSKEFGQESKEVQVQASKEGQDKESKEVQYQAIKEVHCQAIKEAQGQSSKENQGQSSKEVQGQASKEVQGQASKEFQNQASKEVQFQSSKEVQEQVSKDVQDQESKEVQGQESKEVQVQASKEVQGQESKEVLDQASKEVQDQESKEVQDQKSKEVQEQKSKEVQGQESKEVQVQAYINVQGHSSKDVQDQESNEVQGQLSKDVQNQTSKEVLSQSCKDVHDKVSKAVLSQSSKEVQDQAFKEFQDQESKEVQNQASIEVLIQSFNEVHYQASKAVLSQSSKEVQDQTSKEVQGQESKEVQGQESKEVQGQASKEVQGQASKEVQGQSYKEVQDQVSKEVQDQSSKEVQGHLFNEVHCQASKEVQDQESKEVQGHLSKDVQSQASKQFEGQASKQFQGQASIEVQDQGTLQSLEKYLLQCIKVWYPELHTRPYFLPPFHFNRVPYGKENIAGQQLLVAQTPQDKHSQKKSNTKSRSRQQKRQTKSSPAPNLSGPVKNSKQGNLPGTVYDSDVRDDKASERVLYCLRALADNSQPKEVMMVISQLQFENYLGHPSYAATAALLPRPSTLPEHYREGDFDVLIIHRQYGLFTLEIKSVGANFSQLKMTEQEEDDVVMKKVKEALKQLSKSEVVLKHLTSDLTDNNITKILVMSNISSTQLLRAISRNSSDGQDLCQCLGVRSVDDALKMCLLSDQLSDERTASDVNHIVHKDLDVWWKQLVKMSGAQPSITETVYEHLVARFCGPATTVEVHCVTPPRLSIRILGDAVSATGEAMARLVLFPQQVELLRRSPPHVFLIGPPGTGKTTVLIVQGLTWLKLGHDVHVVSTCTESRAVTIAIEHQLKETMKTTKASSRVHRRQFEIKNYGEVKTAVEHLKSLTQGRQMCVIADEAIRSDYRYKKHFKDFCDHLIVQVQGVYLWGASVHHEARPLCLEEVKLTTPLRSPPVVVREVMKAEEIKKKEVVDYTVCDVPVPTDGPAVIRFTHSKGQSGHTEDWPRDCVECGHQVARVLTELNVGRKGNSNGPPPLQYRDVLVLCIGYPTANRVDNNGQVITTASGLVRGLRACNVPVRVVEKGDEAAIRDMALVVGDLVTVTNWRNVRGLERKVVVVENRGFNVLNRLHAMSRSTSQLVLIECRHD